MRHSIYLNSWKAPMLMVFAFLLCFIIPAIGEEESPSFFNGNTTVQCEDFNNGGIGSWQRTAALIANAFDQTPSNGTPFLRGIDRSGISRVYNTAPPYSGDLSCVTQICFDYKIINDGDPQQTTNVNPVFHLYVGNEITPTQSAIFTSPIVVTEDSPWVTVCAQLNATAPPPGWALSNPNGIGWAQLINNVTGISFETDVAPIVTIADTIGVDNICITTTGTTAPHFHIEDEDEVERSSFCPNEPIFLDGLATECETRHFIAIEEIDPNDNATYLFETGNIFTPITMLINLQDLMAANGFAFQSGFSYRVKLAVGNNCTNWAEDWSLPFRIDETEALFHFEDENGDEKTEFCFGETIFMNAEATEHETRYFIALEEIDPDGNANYFYETGNIWTTIPYPVNLNDLMDDASAQTGEEYYFRAGYTYRVKLAVGNRCTNWDEDWMQFTVVCCASTADLIDPKFNLNGTDYEDDHYTIEAINYELYEEFHAVHEWCVFTSPNRESGPYTPVTIITGPDFSYEPAAYGIYYYVTHKIITDCGVYCFTSYNDNGGLRTREKQTEEWDPYDCEILGDVPFPSCELGGAPINLNSIGGVLTWAPVQGATSYIVVIQIGGLTSCHCGGVFPTITQLNTTTNSVIIPDGLADQCFQWTVIANCERGASTVSDPACYYPPRSRSGIENEEKGSNLSRSSSLQEQLYVYPNPASKQLHFYLTDEQLIENGFILQLINLSGELIKSKSFETGTQNGHLDIDELTDGYYLLQFIDETGESYFKKVIISNQ